ncbi:MAG: HEAT repeat domain-containing protein, partial [Planctomycetota bacterium]|nr:HEAT repeat domain-containing protein [Planctomycetota bacterium]
IRSRVLIGWALGFGVSFLGLLLSYDRPSGPMIVSIFGLSLIVLGGARFLIRSKEKKRAAAVVGGISVACLFLLFGLPALTNPTPEGHGHKDHEQHHSEPDTDTEEVRPGVTEEFKNLDSADSVLRETAIDALSKRSDAPALANLAAVLKKETDDGLKLKLALILQQHGRAEGLKALVSLLQESEIPFVRMEAIHHLEEIAGEEFGYNTMQPPSDNAEAIKKMQRWLGKLKAD